MPPSDPVDIATGITVVFGTSAFSAEITDLSGPGVTRESVDVTHQGSVDAMEFIPSDLPDYGELSLDIHFNPDDDPPTELVPETITITWPSTATWAFDGFVTSYEPAGPLNDKMTGTIVIKVDGKITVTPAA